MIDELKSGVDSEIEMLREIALFSKRMESATAQEKRLLSDSVASLSARIKQTNNFVPGMLNRIVLEAPKTKKPAGIKLKMPEAEMGKPAAGETITAKEKETFMKELDINEELIKRLKGKKSTEIEISEGFKEARGYLKLSNRLFLKSAGKLIKKGYFGNFPIELKKANLDVLFETYTAMLLFSVAISFVISIIALLVLLIMGFTRTFWIPLLIPVAVFAALYYYPALEKRTISKKIDEEIPFAVIHMSSISGSGLEPTEIFRIIGLSKEYPYLRKEIRKILNQINIYGYDLVTALNNVSKSTSNQKLAELLGGLSTTINSGGSLPEFFEKRAETLLAAYKLEKEKFIKIAETFMDIYISVVIAAPMILMLLLVMISISGIQTGFSPYELTVATIFGVALINIIFLGFLQAKQA